MWLGKNLVKVTKVVYCFSLEKRAINNIFKLHKILTCWYPRVGGEFGQWDEHSFVLFSPNLTCSLPSDWVELKQIFKLGSKPFFKSKNRSYFDFFFSKAKLFFYKPTYFLFLIWAISTFWCYNAMKCMSF